MVALIEYTELQRDMEDLKDKQSDTHLFLDLKGRDPDEGATDIAYTKGCLFLRTIEETVGREKWDAFIKNYFDSHAF